MSFCTKSVTKSEILAEKLVKNTRLKGQLRERVVFSIAKFEEASECLNEYLHKCQVLTCAFSIRLIILLILE